MQSRQQSTDSKTKERKVEAMRKLKQAYERAQAEGTVNTLKPEEKK